MRVLVAEDDEVIAEFVSQGLREAGYAVDVAATGTEALRKALDGGYDAAGMDVLSRYDLARLLAPAAREVE